MEYGIFEVLQLIGALGFFIYGMKVMSESIQKVAGDKLRNVMSLITSNRVSGVLTGFVTTAVVQSSSATTVMVVSFVNAGLLKLREAIGVIMGANIGTTVTGILIIVFGFSKFSIAHYTLPIIAFGFPLLFMKNMSLRHWGEFLIGFALLFMGLSALKDAVPDLKNNPEILEWIVALNSYGFFSIVIAVVIGTLLTIVVQSSSAAMAITLIMCDNGWIPYDMAAGIVLGENIGTTVTANLAALIGNVHAKRAALAHFAFNVFGVIWMLIIFNYFIGGIDALMIKYTDQGSPLNDVKAIKWGLTYFHISFNLINTLIMIWFIPQIEMLVTKLVKGKEEKEGYHLEFLSNSLMLSPELSLPECRKELGRFAKILIQMNESVILLIHSADKNEQLKLIEEISELEDKTDSLEYDINNFLAKVSQSELSESASNEVQGMLSTTKDMERIGDIFNRMANDIRRKNKHSLNFNERQKENLTDIFSVVSRSLDLMKINLSSEYSKVSLTPARKVEDELNDITKKLNKKHLKGLDNEDYDVHTGIIYRDILIACEKVGDHVINVSENIVGERHEEV